MKKVRDHYFLKAKQAGFSARSVYKLEEIDRKQRLLRPGLRVLDLGCAPGSWLQYAAEKVGPGGLVVGVDLQAIKGGFPEQVRVLQGDVFELKAATLPGEVLNAGGFDLILSDMAPRTTGVKSADATHSAELVLRALALAESWLKPGGSLLTKVFEGGRLPEVRKAFMLSFEKVSLEKPKATRSESVEVFLLGRNKKATIPAKTAPTTPEGEA